MTSHDEETEEEHNARVQREHAEANAIMKVARSTNDCKGATLYLTLSPCKECSKLIHQSGIKRLVYLNKYKDTTGLDFLKKANVELLHFQDVE